MNEIDSTINGSVSDQISNLENRNWINAGSSPVRVKCECCGKEIKDFNSKRFCSIHCKMSFISKCSKNHVNNLPEHQGRGDWVCKDCGLVFETKNKLYDHRHEKHGSVGRQFKKVYYCKYCGYELGKGKYRELWNAHRANCIEFLKDHTKTGHKIWTKEEKEHLSEVQRNNDYRRIMRHTQEYHGILYDSSWEVEMAKRFESLNEVFERPKNSIKYIGVDGKKHNYFPDFYLPNRNVFVEVKNPYLFENDSKVQILKAKRSDIIWLTSLEQIQRFEWGFEYLQHQE